MGDSRGSDSVSTSSDLILFVNGEKIIETNPNPEWTLLYFLRFKLRLCGTKEACGEGGCGACTVLQSKFDETTGKIVNAAINACITPLCSTHGSAIITTEGIGSVKEGLHPVQERIAKSHGTQCGFCTPGFVMSMYALLRNNPEPTEQEMEDAFQGNLCRCTGYRPIMEGFKTFCKESASSANGCCGGKGKNGGCCMDGFINDGESRTELANTLFDASEFKKYDPKADIIFPSELQLNKNLRKQSLKFHGSDVIWLKPSSLEELLKIKQQHPNSKCVGGNTELGIEVKFKQQLYPVFIHISEIDELAQIQVCDNRLKIGGSATLSRLQTFCKEMSSTSKRSCGTVLEALLEMLYWFAGQQIKNVATIAGNIITASPISDLIPVLMASGAVVNLRSLKDGKRSVKMDESFFPKYRTTVMQPHEILESIEVPLTQGNEYVWAVKQARRREDDIAIVNACMRVVVNPETLHIEDASVVYGGMAPTTKIAKKTSQFLLQKKWSEKTFETAANELYEEMKLEANAPGGMVAYRQVLTQSFLSKFFMTVSSWISQKNIMLSAKQNDSSAVTPIARGETSGVQLYQIVPKSQKVEDLIGRPTAHLSALKHATGEAVYTDDEVPLLGQLHGALVGSPIAHGKIISIDASKALAIPGVVEFLSAKSIAADQNVQGHIIDDEEIFASEYVHCQGQSIGIIIAVDPLTAEKASKLVEMKFEELTPILTIEDAVKKESYHAVRKLRAGNISEAFENADEILEGEMRIGGQEHFYMEPQSCIATPKEDQEMDILMSCQGPDYVQKHVAKTLKVPANRVKVRCRRMGGGFGGKESRTCIVSLPTALAAVKLGKSVKTVMNRWDDMVVTGGRHPFQCRYKLAITKEGRILGVQATLYSNGGCSSDASPPVMEKALMSIEAVYTIPHWDMHGFACKTNLASNTAFRGYGGPQASIFMENIMDAVAEKVGKSPVVIREMHLQQQNGDKCPMGYIVTDCMVRRCWEECVRGANYEARKLKVEEFNRENRWKKRGITVTPMKHNVGFHMSLLNQGGALVMIYTDGSVGLNHGGTEMGQGLHTKMAQIASRALGIPIAKIYHSEASTDKVPNATATCASMSSDLNGMAVMYACQKLAKRLEPFKTKNPNGTWEDWVGAAYFNRVNLSAVGFYELDLNYDFDNPQDLRRDPQSYVVYGVAVSEVEVDCLTGDHSVLRTDIVMDAGESMNPAVDVGQIEGAFMQGYGLLTMEELLYSPKGLMITKGPGMYKIPSMGDIPRIFNVSMLRGAPNPKAVYSSKGLGEPPLFLAASIFFAIKEAIKAARSEVGLSTLFRFDAPATVERIRLAFEDEAVTKVKEGMKGSEGKPGWAITV